MKILILCTGNSCRSQMAHGLLKSFDPNLAVYSGGTKPEDQVNPFAIRVMQEVGIDISHHEPAHVDRYVDKSFDYLITVCDNAKETCPVFSGSVKRRLHIGFEDPAAYKGNDDEVLKHYRRIRDQIMERFKEFYNERILKVNF